MTRSPGSYRELLAPERAEAFAEVAASGYHRDLHPEEQHRPWFTNGEGYLWFQAIADQPDTLAMHWCALPGKRVGDRVLPRPPPADWTALVREIAGTLGARRVLIYIPVERQELHWRALRRYALCRGWAQSPLGPVLEV